MTITVFVNDQDQKVAVLGKALYSLLDRQYFVFTREPSEYPTCPVDKTLGKLREIAQHITEDRLVVCFGCRVFPGNIKAIEALAAQNKGNLVFLKRLRGSKTWTMTDKGLAFDNERIADCGIFVLNKQDLIGSDQINFNSFIRTLIQKKSLNPVFVDFWIFSNSEKNKSRSRGRR